MANATGAPRSFALRLNTHAENRLPVLGDLRQRLVTCSARVSGSGAASASMTTMHAYKVIEKRVKGVDLVEELALFRGDVAVLDECRRLHHEVDARHRVVAAKNYKRARTVGDMTEC